MDNKKLLGKRIKEIRKKFGYTQEQVTEQNYSNKVLIYKALKAVFSC